MRAWIVVMLAGLAACGARPLAPPVVKGVIVIHCDVRDAAVWIDDQPIGEVAEIPGGVRLPVGDHRLELRHDRYHTRYLMVTVAAGAPRAIDVKLAEALP